MERDEVCARRCTALHCKMNAVANDLIDGMTSGGMGGEMVL